MAFQVLLLLLSIIVLYFGAEFVLDAAEKIGKYFGLSPLVIGLLLIGFGTSLPEFFVSQLASFRSHPELAMGNIVGSNIANLLLIMGITGLMVPLSLSQKDIKFQLILHIILTALLSGVLLYAKINYITMATLGSFFVFYMWITFQNMKKHNATGDDYKKDREKLAIATYVKLLIGFAFLYGGGELLVTSGSGLASSMGISEYAISAIFVAFGTSFPELVTAIMACKKKKDINLITGNIIGSNIFNVAFVLGSLGIHDFSIKNDFTVEIIGLTCIAFLLKALSVANIKFGRLLGVIFLTGYGGLIYYWL